MKIYVPVAIESVEQAEALPEGTLATHRDHWPLEKFRDAWEGCDTTWDHSQVIGWTALVPIEAEEEWRASWPEDDAHQRCRDERTARLWADQQDAVAMSRLTTPWKES